MSIPLIYFKPHPGNYEYCGAELAVTAVLCLDYDSSRSQGVCGSPDDTLVVFDVSEQHSLSKNYNILLRNKGVADVRIRGDSKIIASGGWDGRIRVFGWKKGKPLAVLNYHLAAVNCISFAARTALEEHRNVLICGSRDQRITLWKLY